MRASTTSDTAMALALLGGLLIFVEGLLASLAVFRDAAVFGILAGLAIMAMAVTFRPRARYKRELGAAILLLSLTSFFGVSGFLIGALLGVIAGILALTSSVSPFSGSPVSVYSAKASGTSFSIGSACSRCGKSVPGWTGTCPYCGFPER